MKTVKLLLIVVSMVILVACDSNTKSSSSALEKTTKQAVTAENLMGEWECIDIVAGSMHMKNIAKMQPHIVFNDKNKIMSKLKLPDGTFASQTVGSYTIENGEVVSKFYEHNLYMENGKLIVEHASSDDKQIYAKLK